MNTFQQDKSPGESLKIKAMSWFTTNHENHHSCVPITPKTSLDSTLLKTRQTKSKTTPLVCTNPPTDTVYGTEFLQQTLSCTKGALSAILANSPYTRFFFSLDNNFLFDSVWFHFHYVQQIATQFCTPTWWK